MQNPTRFSGIHPSGRAAGAICIVLGILLAVVDPLRWLPAGWPS